ncbi:hypothetical protein Sango_2083000 [Sesamum angolense]|uniref:Mitochondrial transcription termination factor family protein n=1 Tax=Sesamum angolense TaxID=2727404 RepID=A0AAE2BLY2_9LAMI|nr:hypothetical protein Sango_2083000 [Sesamum angolense]
MMNLLVRKSLTCLDFKNSSFLRQSHVFLSHYFCTKRETQRVDSDTPTVSEFLLHKHHFSPEAAAQVASVLTRLKNTEKSDSVLSFLKESGFSGTQLEKIVKYKPEFLSANLEKVIKPKIKIFQDFGFSERLGSEVDLAKVLKSSGWILIRDLQKTLVPNVEFLKSCGIPFDQIVRLIPTFPRFFLLKPKLMRKSVEKADQMGVDRSSGMFIYAARVVSSMSDETWELKLKAFRDLGFAEDDILRAFRTAPMVFSVSTKKLKKITEVLLETGKYDMSCIMNTPTSLLYSVENRYRPRLQVLEVLEKRNLIKNWPALGTVNLTSDKKFFEKFVAPYLDELKSFFAAKTAYQLRSVLNSALTCILCDEAHQLKQMIMHNPALWLLLRLSLKQTWPIRSCQATPAPWFLVDRDSKDMWMPKTLKRLRLGKLSTWLRKTTGIGSISAVSPNSTILEINICTFISYSHVSRNPNIVAHKLAICTGARFDSSSGFTPAETYRFCA